MIKQNIYIDDNVHIGYTKIYSDGTVVWLNLLQQIHREDGPAIIELENTVHHNYIVHGIHSKKYCGRYQKWYSYPNGKKINQNKKRELWYLDGIHYQTLEQFPHNLFLAYCRWNYKEEK